MENAGRNLGKVIADRYGFLNERSGALGLVGSGNNGGDTLVALTYLIGEDWPASACLVRPRSDDDPLIELFMQAGGTIYRHKDDPDFEQLARLLQSHSVILDGILGTGIQLPLKPELAKVLQTTRECWRKWMTPQSSWLCDCPSGVDCDSGDAAPECIPAELTVTMAAVKRGLLKIPGIFSPG